MKSLATLLERGRTLRAIGFDDGPFARDQLELVPVAGVVCAGTRLEGLLWTGVRKDGLEATEVVGRLVAESKFHAQVHVLLFDGLGVAGFNLIDLAALAERLERPCIAVMRRLPDMPKVLRAIDQLPDASVRRRLLERAGPIHSIDPFHFQVRGAEPDVARRVLERLTDRGHVPEPLRLAHLITAAVVTGSSGKRA